MSFPKYTEVSWWRRMLHYGLFGAVSSVISDLRSVHTRQEQVAFAIAGLVLFGLFVWTSYNTVLMKKDGP